MQAIDTAEEGALFLTASIVTNQSVFKFKLDELP